MASGGAIEAGRAFVELFLRDAEFQKGVKRVQAHALRLSRSIAQIGTKMLMLGTAAILPMAAAVKVAQDFEEQMARVATMLAEPERHMAAFAEGVRRLSREFGESTETLSKGLYDILSASVAPAQALAVLEVSTRAAAAGISDTGTAADAITTILNAYSIDASQAADVSDWLFSVVKRGKTTFSELAPSIGMVATTAASAGVSLEEVGAALATMTRAGVRTDNAVTALNALISSFLTPTSDATKAAKELGFAMSTSTLQTEGLASVFDRIAALSPDAVARLFPNVRALRGVLPALKNMAGFSEDLATMATRAGATDEAFKQIEKTLRFKQAKQSLLDAVRLIGGGLLPLAVELAEAVAGLAKRFGAWAEANGDLLRTYTELIAKGALWVAGIGGGLLVVGKLIGAVGGLIGAMGALHTATLWLAANPMVLAFAGSAAIITGVVLAANRAADAQLRMAEAASRAAAEEASAAQARLDAGDKQRAADLARMRRLERLAEKERLSNAEMSEAQAIIDSLQTAYGNLGLSLDTATGKIAGMTEAQAALNAQLRENAKAEAETALATARLEMTKKREEHDAVLASRKTSVLHTVTGGAIGIGESNVEHVKRVARAGEELSLATQRWHDAMRRVKTLSGETVEEGALTGEGGAPATPDERIADAKELQKIEQESAKRTLDLAHELARLRLANIENAHDRQAAAIDLEHEHESQAIRDTYAEKIAGIEDVSAEQVAAINVQRDAELAVLGLVADEKRRQNEAAWQKAAEDERKRSAEDIAAAEQRAADSASQSEAETIRNARIAAAKRRGEDTDLAELRFRKEQLEKERQRRIQEAREMGSAEDTAGLVAAINRDITAQIVLANQAYEANRAPEVGSLSTVKVTAGQGAAAAWGIGAAGDVQERILRENRRVAENTEYLKNQAQRGGLAFA